MVSDDLDNALARRLAAKAEIDRLKTVVSACDGEIMNALDARDDEFYRWVLEVRGEIASVENRKVVWTSPAGEKYSVFKQKGAEPRKTISAEKLLKLGVPPHVIQAATTFGEPGKPGVRVRKIVSHEEEDE